MVDHRHKVDQQTVDAQCRGVVNIGAARKTSMSLMKKIRPRIQEDDGRGHCERGREVGVAEENGVIVVAMGEVVVVEDVGVKVGIVIVNEVVRSLRRRSFVVIE